MNEIFFMLVSDYVLVDRFLSLDELKLNSKISEDLNIKLSLSNGLCNFECQWPILETIILN